MKLYVRRAQKRKRRLRYPLKPTSFVTSVFLHALLFTVIILSPIGHPYPPPARSLYELEIKPFEHKIIWYNFREEVPNLPAMQKIGKAKDTQGNVVSEQTIIASEKNSKLKQFIWQPKPETITEEVKAPNVVAVKSSPPPPPPAAPPIIEAPRLVAPPVAAPEVPNNDPGLALFKKPPKRFEPQAQKPKLTVETAPTITETLPGSILGGSAPPPDAPSGLTNLKIPPKKYVPPKTAKATGSGSDAGKAATITAPVPDLSAGNVNMAIVGLNPSDLPPPVIPSGTLAGQFSTAPKAGKASTGNLPTQPNGIPNLMVDGGARSKAGASAGPPANIPDARKTVLYKQVATGPIPSTLSAPLRPGTRTIPGSLEARFQGISVYTLVLPGPNLQGYAGDWVLWFAERQPDGEATVQMRAPVPYRKRVLDQAAGAAGGSVSRVQIVGVVGKDGHLDQVAILKAANAGAAQAILEDLKAWEFTPATRNLVPVDVDVVIEIPFRL
jgi:hypothetical protein